MDYKPFKDEASWIRFKERFTTIESHGLGHIIDINHVIDNLDLDKIQRGWLYKILQDTIQAPQGKSIVTKHIDDKDTRKIWEELCEYYDHSMSLTFNPARSQRTNVDTIRPHRMARNSSLVHRTMDRAGAHL
jgi:hypothetical protein